jgi:hypothetical protein
MKYKLDRSTVMMEEMMITEMIIVVMALWTSRPIHTSMLRKSTWRRRMKVPVKRTRVEGKVEGLAKCLFLHKTILNPKNR